MPFTVKKQDWAALLAGVQATDRFTFDPNTGEVVPGSDGVAELHMYPGAATKNGKHTTPGNWGAVDIGNTNNSTADLRRQIRDGVSANDLDPYGGVLSLDPHTGTITQRDAIIGHGVATDRGAERFSSC